MQVEVLLTP